MQAAVIEQPVENRIFGPATHNVHVMLTGADSDERLGPIHYRQQLLGVPDAKRVKQLHMTALNLLLNTDHPFSRFFIDRVQKGRFVKHLQAVYAQFSAQTVVESKSGNYAMLNGHFAKIYNETASPKITMLRKAMYQYFEQRAKSHQRRVVEHDSKTYYVYTYDGVDLLAVPGHYHGKGNWKAHISLAKLVDMEPELIARYHETDSQFPGYGLSVLVNALSDASHPKYNINTLNLGECFGKIKVSNIQVNP